MPDNNSSNAPKIRQKTIFDGFLVKRVFKLIYIIWFKLAGWKAVNQIKPGAGIAIAAPHTSNWDIVYALGAAIIYDVKIYFSIKQSWCKIPVIGRFILWLGGMPIDRKAGGQAAVIREFILDLPEQARPIYFLFTPEGTRGAVDKWRTGFYHVAQDCELPIFLCKVDYKNKESGAYHAYQLSDNKEKDIDAIQASYKTICGRYPDLQYPTYEGQRPEISAREVQIMQSLHALKGRATRAEIAAKAKFQEVTNEMLDFLIAKGIIEKQQIIDETGKATTRYTLTVAGNGALLHMAPSLTPA